MKAEKPARGIGWVRRQVTQKRLGDIVINCSAGTQPVLKRFSFTVPYGYEEYLSSMKTD